MSRYDNNNSSGLGLLDVAEIACFIVFLVLKLVGVIIVMWIYIKWDGRHY